ncbi:Potassium-transporting ATPase ATP-binding subunit [Streptomyces narbonensis]
MALPELDTAQVTTPASVPVRAVGRTRATDLPEVRWAALAALTFLAAFPLDLAGAPAWAWGPLYAVCYAAGGWEPAVAGLRALRERSLDVDLLMVVAALGAAAIGQYLDGGLLIVIFAVSGALEALATRRTADSVRGLLDLAPATAVRLTGAEAREETVEATALSPGDTVLVRPGERLPADGTVLGGTSDVDRASITGEPLPAPVAPGDEVFAGSLNGTGALRVRVDKDPGDFVVARIVALVEEAGATKAPTQLFVEKIEQRYSVGVVVATLALFGLPVAFGTDLTEALLRAMTFMIVASPCAVVLATMPPLLSAIATAGRHGVLVKSAVVMERLGAVDRVALDKTGTLTEGAPRVTAVRGDATALALAAAAELPSEHPLARAVVAEARARGLRLPEATDFAAEPGRGVRAVVDGHEVRVHRAPGNHGDTAVEVVVDGAPAAVLEFSDRLREGAPGAVAALARLTGTAPTLLTGDNEGAAVRIAAETGIDDALLLDVTPDRAPGDALVGQLVDDLGVELATDAGDLGLPVTVPVVDLCDVLDALHEARERLELRPLVVRVPQRNVDVDGLLHHAHGASSCSSSRDNAGSPRAYPVTRGSFVTFRAGGRHRAVGTGRSAPGGRHRAVGSGRRHRAVDRRSTRPLGGRQPGERAVAEAGQELGRVAVDGGRARLLQLRAGRAAAQQSDTGHTGTGSRLHVPDGVADEHGGAGPHPDQVEGVVYGIGRGLPPLHVVRRRGVGDGVVGVDGPPQRLELAVLRGGDEDDLPPVVRQRAEEFRGGVQRGQPVEVRGVQGVVGGAQPVVAFVVPVLAQEVIEEVGPGQTDGPVDGVRRDPVPGLAQRLPPGDDMEVVGVGEGAVDVEESGAVHGRGLLRASGARAGARPRPIPGRASAGRRRSGAGRPR